MSLLKFLTTGHSLVGMRDTNSRYKMRSENLLPKFISPKNPFAQPAKAETKPSATTAERASGTMVTGSLFDAGSHRSTTTTQAEPARVPAPTPAAVTTPAPSAAPAPVVAREVKVSVPRPSQPVKVEIKRVETKPAPAIPTVAATKKPAVKPRRWFAWVQKLNPIGLFRAIGFGTKARHRGAAAKQVQGELTLERIQVVRNDLRDADLEIVPGRLMGIPSGASPVLGSSVRPDTGGWSRMTNRMIGLEHTQI